MLATSACALPTKNNNTPAAMRLKQISPFMRFPRPATATSPNSILNQQKLWQKLDRRGSEIRQGGRDMSMGGAYRLARKNRCLGAHPRDPPRLVVFTRGVRVRDEPLQSSDACDATAQTSVHARCNVTRIKPATASGLAQSVLTTMEFFRLCFEIFCVAIGTETKPSVMLA
jgi:hypothetical protein